MIFINLDSNGIENGRSSENASKNNIGSGLFS
jgi:hypothetical protein